MPRQVDPDAEREALLEVCFRMFATHGYAAVGVRQIARAAGVSTGKVYHYFSSKSDILQRMFDLMVSRDEARVRNTLPEDAPVPVRIAAVYRFVQDHRAYLIDLVRLALEVHRHEADGADRDQVQQAVARYRGAMAGILAVDNPELEGMVFSFLVGTLVHGLLDAPAVDLDAQCAFTQALWVQGFGGEG